MKNRLAEILEARKMTQWQLAMAAGIDSTAINRIVNHEIDVRLSTATKIAQALNLPVGEIFPGEPVQQK